MNTHAKIATVTPTDISPEEWQARTDLAAAYRLIAHYGWGDVIYNHSSMRVPGEERKFLIKRHELLYTEVTASNLVKVSMDDDLDEFSGRESARLHPARRRPLRASGRELRGPRSHRDRHGDRGLEERTAHALAAGDPVPQSRRLSPL